MVRKMNDNNKKYLLILPCSKRKNLFSETSALDLYDGPFYRVLRKNMPPNLDSLILSAKYGLISSKDTVSYYDQIMTPERAEELSPEIMTKLETIIRNGCYDEIFINLGKTYMLALEESRDMLDGYNVCWAGGQIGERLHQLKTWLQIISDNGAGGA